MKKITGYRLPITGYGRIGVLLGGPSSEREVSLRSGNAAYEALKAAGHDVVAIDAVGDIEEKIKDSRICVAFIALHGRFGEDGGIQTILENMGIPYTGSGPQASARAIDKEISRRIFKENGILVPNSRTLFRNYSLEKFIAENTLKFPLVIKPACEGSSIGLSIIENKETLQEAVDKAFHYDEKIIVEEFIQGKEVTVGILEDKPLPVVQIVPKNRFYDYHAKYTKGMTEYIVPAKITKTEYKAAQKAGVKAHTALGCKGFSRVDIIIDKNKKPVVLEVNTIPGFTQTSLLPKAAAAEGINFTKLCEKLVELAYEKDKVMEEKA